MREPRWGTEPETGKQIKGPSAHHRASALLYRKIYVEREYEFEVLFGNGLAASDNLVFISDRAGFLDGQSPALVGF